MRDRARVAAVSEAPKQMGPRPVTIPSLARPHWVDRVLHGAMGRGERVGVIDSGWDRGLLDPRVLPGIGLVDPTDELALRRSADDHDRIGHGTACADLILRLAPGARIVPIRVFGSELETSPHVLCEAIRWAAEQRIGVVNLSLGTFRQDALTPLYLACEYARSKGTLVVAAVHASRPSSFPAIFENVIGVGAAETSTLWEIRYAAGAGAECLASARHQLLLWTGGERRAGAGTSFAAPVVSALAAVLRERHPGAGVKEMRSLLWHYAAAAGEVGGGGENAPES